MGSVPGSGKSLGEGNDNPLHCSCLGDPMDRGAWWATVYGVARESHTTSQNKCFLQNIEIKLKIETMLISVLFWGLDISFLLMGMERPLYIKKWIVHKLFHMFHIKFSYVSIHM